MPVYEYRCSECGHRFDLIQPMDAERVVDCEKCGAQANRVFSPRVAIRYESWGFNSTDKLLPEDSRVKRDFKKLREKAEQIMEDDYSPEPFK